MVNSKLKALGGRKPPSRHLVPQTGTLSRAKLQSGHQYKHINTACRPTNSVTALKAKTVST